MYESSTCEKCGGVCCKNAPGRFSPDDLLRIAGTIYDAALILLSSGKYVIDCYESDPREDAPDCCDCEDVDCDGCSRISSVPLIRPRAENDDVGLRSRAWHRGKCVFLTDTGCTLAPDDRPYECRELEPRPDKQCISHSGGPGKIALLWISYIQDVERAALDCEEDK